METLFCTNLLKLNRKRAQRSFRASLQIQRLNSRDILDESQAIISSEYATIHEKFCEESNSKEPRSEAVETSENLNLKIGSNHNFLHKEIANKIVENLDLFDRKFENALEIGALDGYLSGSLQLNGKVKNIFQSEIFSSEISDLVCDQEFLPFKSESFDLVVSNLNFHHLNFPPQFLLQVKNILKPGGVFIATFFGEEVLRELRHVFFEAETEIYNAVSPRIIPTIDVKTAANLLAKAGFKDPISDLQKIEVEYSCVESLMRDLRFMGQGNILKKRSRKFATKKLLKKMNEIYQKLYSRESGYIFASFDVVTIFARK